VGAIKNFLELREKYNAPLWLGESGENSNAWFTEAIQLVEDHGIGWAWWQEKKMGINNPLEIKRPEGYDMLLDYWAGKGEKPSAAEAWKILQELLENIKIENNVFHKDVIDAMFRQVRSGEAIPFKKHVLDKELIIQAVDFDLGRQRVAYYDKDSAWYQYTPGVDTRGNRGRMYRNDGVDISKGDEGYFINYTEDDEWMQYTIDVKEAGNYSISVMVASDSTGGKLSVLTNGIQIISPISIENTGGEQKWKNIKAGNVAFKKGLNRIRIYIEKGGFNLKEMTIVKKD